MNYTIGELSTAFGLSRSTLIYYDKLGLLTPSARSETNYRQYSEYDYRRLNKIMMYRDTGMSLKAIAELLNQKDKTNRIELLETQVKQIQQEILQLRKQQQITIELLQSDGINLPTHSMNKEQWVQLLSASGMSDQDMWQWHIEFEQRMPEAHQHFLESLNISKQEIKEIREKSKGEYR